MCKLAGILNDVIVTSREGRVSRNNNVQRLVRIL